MNDLRMNLPQIQPDIPKYDILLTGSYFTDLIFTGLPEIPRLGHEIYCSSFDMTAGASFIPAVALKRLGLRAAWPCSFGNDLFSRFVLEQVRQEGLDERFFHLEDHPLRAVTVSYSFTHERAFMTYTDPIHLYPYPEITRQIRPRAVFLTHLWSGPDMHEVVKASREVGALIMMECQAHQLRMIDPDIQDSLRSVDIFVPNAAEAMLLTETSSVEDAIRLLAELIPITVIKLGKDGAVAAEGPKVVWEPAIKVDVVDTTGAGDNFDCGFLYGYLKGLSLQDCLRCGNICGGQSTTRCGGTAASPSMKQLEEFLNCSYP